MTRYRFFGASFLCLLSWSSGQAYKLPSEPIQIEKVKPPSARVVVDAFHRVLDYWYGPQLRIYVPKAKIDAHLAEMVVWSEDAKFWTHGGFDIEEIKNSLKKNLENGGIKRGGSTITQQLAKNLFLDKEKSFVRKLFEIPWAIRLEKDLKKNQILELYLNTIEWGPGVYGAEAACRHYFDRSCESLDVGQVLYLVVIIPNPPRFDLFGHPAARAAVQSRRKFLVHRLIDEKKISVDARDLYLNSDFGLVAPEAEGRHFPVSHQGDYFGNRSRRAEWLKLLEKHLAFARGVEIKTKLDRDEMQKIEALPLLAAPGSKERYLVKGTDENIVAFKRIPAGKTLIVEDLDGEWREIEKMPWSRLIR